MDILEVLGKQADHAEVMTTASETTTVRFESNRLKGSEVEETQGIAVRVVKDGRLGFSATSDPTAMDKLVENALASTDYGDEVPLTFPGPQPGPDVTTYDSRIVELPIPRMVEIGQEIIDLLIEVDPDILVNVELQRGKESTTIRNDAGADVAFERSPFSLSVDINRVKGDDILMIYDVSGFTVWEEDVLRSARQLVEKLQMARRIATVTSGEMPVLFSPIGTPVLGLPLMVGLNGRDVYKGISPLEGKLGQKLLHESFSLVDDPTLDGRFGSASHDDEGVAHRRTPLIEGGVLKSFYYDLKTAAQAGVAPTGNGSRGLFGTPNPSVTNLVVEPGTTSVADIIAGIDEGLLVDNVLGLGQGNIISGAFSNPLSLAFKIEKGEIVGRVKDAAIAGNVYEDMQEIAAISKETAWIYNSFSMPYILLPDLNVVAKA